MAENENVLIKCKKCNRPLYDVSPNDDTIPNSKKCPHCHYLNRNIHARRNSQLKGKK